MRIRTLLVTGTIVSGAVVATVIAYLVTAARNLETTLAQDRGAGTIIVSLFEQSEILSDYLFHPGERARVQWQSKHEAIGRLLDDIAALDSAEDPLILRMQAHHGKTADAFSRLLHSLENRQTVLNELQEHRAAEVRLASQTMLSLATELVRKAEASFSQTRYELAWSVAVLIAAIVALLAGVWFIVGWRVVGPVGRLQQEITAFRGGRVGTWHGIRNDDEIGDVARAFQGMAENLATVMVSRDELAKEVESRKQAEQTARQLADSVQAHAQQLDAVIKELESFAYSVSHDLRAPLRSMAGFCQALVEDYGPALDDTGRDYVQRISAASKRMGQLIDDLLTLSRVTRTEIRHTEVDLSEMAGIIAEQLHLSEPHRQVAFRIQPGMTAQGDEPLLRTVLENLIGNAWKYSSKKPNATIEFGRSANGAEPAYYVRDDGAGFDMAHADKLFQPFQRLHRASEFEGTGIGLASVANIIRRHGGRIWADSKLGAGTTMHFTVSP